VKAKGGGENDRFGAPPFLLYAKNPPKCIWAVGFVERTARMSAPKTEVGLVRCNQWTTLFLGCAGFELRNYPDRRIGGPIRRSALFPGRARQWFKNRSGRRIGGPIRWSVSFPGRIVWMWRNGASRWIGGLIQRPARF
jgi:hypothetical protein